MRASADPIRRVLPNTGAQLVQPSLRALIGLILSVALARHLGPHGFGEYGLVTAFVLLFTAALPELGISGVVVREMARSPEHRSALLASASMLSLGAAGAAYVVIAGVAFVSGYRDEVRASLALLGLTVFIAPVQMLTTHFEVDLRLDRLLPPWIAGAALQLVLVLGVVILGGGLVAIAAAATVALVIEHAWMAALVIRDVALERPSTRHWPMLAREAWPIASASIITAAARQAPAIALSLVDLRWVGLFTAADRIAMYATRIALALRTSMYPLLAERWSRREDLGDLLRRAILAVSTASALAVAAGTFLAGPAVRLLYGPAFDAAAEILVVLLVAAGCAAVAMLLGAALLAMGAQRTSLLISVAAAAVLIAALWLTLSRGEGPIAAALGVLLWTATIMVLSAIAVGRASAMRQDARVSPR